MKIKINPFNSVLLKYSIKKMDQVNVTKLTATQNVIRNKFEETYKNRLEHEHDVNRAMKSLPASSSTSTMNYAIETRSIGINEEMQYDYDPNELCLRLKFLLNSKFTDNEHNTHEISSIITKLREAKIIT